MYFLTVAVGYFLGSINTAIILSKLLYNKDIRNMGSGNAGTANTLRNFGKGIAVIVLAGDMLKGLIAVFAAKLLAGQNQKNSLYIFIAGIAVIIGHLYPAFFGFKGGKGVATAAAVILAIEPVLFLVIITLYVFILRATRYVSLASVCCAALYPVLTAAFLYLKDRPIAAETIFAASIGILIVSKHRSNIMKLKRGSERRFVLKRNKG